MPYITSERVKEIREALKKKFPQVKFSVTREHYSSVNIKIMESPFTWSKDYLSLNHFYLEREENSSFLLEIKKIANEGNYIESTDGDYGNIPSFYLNMQVGKWDRPHKTKNAVKDLDAEEDEDWDRLIRSGILKKV